MNKKISIIVPVYNVEKYIDRCLTSLVNQTYKNIEIILVDDGSTDNSYNKIVEWKEKYNNKIKVFKQKNQGPGEARNFGIENCTGDFFTFVDSDDYLDLDFIENLTNFSDGYDLIISGSRGVNDEKILFNRKLKDTEWTKFMQLVVWAKLYKTSFIKDNNIKFQKFMTGEDICFSMNVISKFPKIKSISYIGYNYYFGNQNSITIDKKVQIDSNILEMNEYIQSIISNTEFLMKNKKNIGYFFKKDLIEKLFRKATYLEYNSYLLCEEEYYNWLINFFKENNIKFKFEINKEEKFYVNFIINFYVICRKLNMRKLFLKILYLWTNRNK